MSKVIVNESSLADIANAIREKNGKSEPYFPREMGDAIREIEAGGGAVIESLEITGNGTYNAPTGVDGYSPITVNVPQDGSPPEEAFLITGNCRYRFYNENWDWFINMYGNQVITSDITQADNMFYGTLCTEIPFELNFDNVNHSSHNIEYMFGNASLLTTIPKINNCIPLKLSNIFFMCSYLRQLPEDIESGFDWSYLDNMTSMYSGGAEQMFAQCYSLRSIPMNFLSHGNPNIYYTYSIYNKAFSNCWTLDEIIDLPNPHYNSTWNSNAFSSTFYRCLRLKNLTFATPNGQPYVVNWKSQTIDLCEVGWLGTNNYPSQITSDYNSGITADKLVNNDATYQALKDDPDWFTNNEAYCRYNHDSAVATINSLPDTSAYLAANGGTNTIKFTGSAGYKTDGGAISTLTEEEIAVATAKGWTVSLV